MTFLDRTQRRVTVGRTPVDEWLAHCRERYMTTHNAQNRHGCPRWDSNPQSRQASGRRPTPLTARPLGSTASNNVAWDGGRRGGRERGWKSFNIMALVGLLERREPSEYPNLRYEYNIRKELKEMGRVAQSV